jgi:dipeptidyl aminopeptidase/acylaminoacyl peptidase
MRRIKIMAAGIVTSLIINFIIASPARGQEARGQMTTQAERPDIERYLNIRSASSPTLPARRGDQTPRRLAFLTNITGTAQIWMMNASNCPEQMTFYSDRVDFVEWSPAGTGLIFGKARGGDENAQFFWMSPDGSRIRQLTNDPRVRHNFGAWSSDGRRISYASNKRDRNFFDVYVMDVETGREELVYQQNGSNAAGEWSHDDRFIVVSRASDTLSLDNDLYLVNVGTREAVHLTPHTGAAEFDAAGFTADNRALILTTNKDREWSSLARLDLQTKRIEILDNTSWDVGGVAMSDSGNRIAYSINRDGFSELYLRDLSAGGQLGRATQIELPSRGVTSSLSLVASGRGNEADMLLFTFTSANRPSDVWAYMQNRTGARPQLTQLTRSSLAGIRPETLVEPELIRFRSFDGREIPAWYYRPQSALRGRERQQITFTSGPNRIGGSFFSNLPVIVSVHGGPEGQERPAFNAIYQYFLARGYAVLAPNVRGSTGYGKTYTHLDDVRNREDSVRDLAASVEWLRTQGGADARRIAVMGGSYGGYMTLAAVTLYPDLWAAAVNTVGIANFESFLRNTSGYRRRQREREYGTLENDLEFLRSISPLNRVERIRAPMMVIHGRNDPRVPYTEAEQIVEALRRRNQPVEYVLFDDEGHGVAKLSNRLIVYPRMADFLDRHMQGQSR